jgi:hypothetical protein
MAAQHPRIFNWSPRQMQLVISPARASMAREYQTDSAACDSIPRGSYKVLFKSLESSLYDGTTCAILLRRGLHGQISML